MSDLTRAERADIVSALSASAARYAAEAERMFRAIGDTKRLRPSIAALNETARRLQILAHKIESNQ